MAFGPRIPNLPRIRLLGPKTDFGAQNALFRPKSLFGQKGLHFHSFPIGFISIRGMGAPKGTFSQKMPFWAQNRKKSENAQFGWMNAFLGRNSQCWASWWPDGQKDNLYVSSWELQSALFAQNRTLRPKDHFWAKRVFWTQIAFLGPKCVFDAKSAFWEFWSKMPPFRLCFTSVWR